MEEYKTILDRQSAEFVEKKSKFIATAVPVSNQKEATQFIEEMKTKYWDATHNVYAYILLENNFKKYSDDGEPQGTSGIPSLTVLEGAGLFNTAVVVTRYFGGTLLGTGGLIRAYTQSVKNVIEKCTIVTNCMCKKVSIKCDYSLWGKIQNYLTGNGVPVESVEYSSFVSANIVQKVALCDMLISDITELTDASAVCTVSDTAYMKIDENKKLIK